MHGVNWRTPFTWLRKKSEEAFKKKEAARDSAFDLDEKEMQEVMDLVHRRMTIQNGQKFMVHPPKKLIENPDIAKNDDVIEQLKDDIFEVVFQDGHHAMIGLSQLMVFAHELIAMHVATREIEQTIPKNAVSATIKREICPAKIMKPEMVKLLLSKFEFSQSPSDDAEVSMVENMQTNAAQ